MKIKELKATNGYYLTQVDEVGDERVYLTAIKGINVVEYDWRQATEEEKAAWEEAQKSKDTNVIE